MRAAAAPLRAAPLPGASSRLRLRPTAAGGAWGACARRWRGKKGLRTAGCASCDAPRRPVLRTPPGAPAARAARQDNGHAPGSHLVSMTLNMVLPGAPAHRGGPRVPSTGPWRAGTSCTRLGCICTAQRIDPRGQRRSGGVFGGLCAQTAAKAAGRGHSREKARRIQQSKQRPGAKAKRRSARGFSPSDIWQPASFSALRPQGHAPAS